MSSAREVEIRECRRVRHALRHTKARLEAGKDAIAKDGSKAAGATGEEGTVSPTRLTAAKKKQLEKEMLIGTGISAETDPVLKGKAHLYRDPNVPLKFAAWRRNSFNCPEGKMLKLNDDNADPEGDALANRMKEREKKAAQAKKKNKASDGPFDDLPEADSHTLGTGVTSVSTVPRACPVPIDERGVHAHAAEGSYIAARRECQFALEALQREFCAQKVQAKLEDDGTELGALKKAEAEKQAAKLGLPKKRKKFFDVSFFLGSRGALYPEGTKGHCSIDEPESIMRLDEVYPGCPLFDPALEESDDCTFLLPGGVADGHILSAISAVMQHKREDTLMQPLPKCHRDVPVPGSTTEKFPLSGDDEAPFLTSMEDPTQSNMTGSDSDQEDEALRRIRISRQSIQQLFVVPNKPSQHLVGPSPGTKTAPAEDVKIEDFVTEVGCVGVLLYVNGAWTWVIVDTTILVDEENKPSFLDARVLPIDLTLDDVLSVGVSSTISSNAQRQLENTPVGRMSAALAELLKKPNLTAAQKDEQIYMLLHDYLHHQLESPSEVWPMLLEKAIAKAHGSYDAIDGGVCLEMLSNLSGGTSKALWLDSHLRQEAIDAEAQASSGDGSKGVSFHHQLRGGSSVPWDLMPTFESLQDVVEGEGNLVVTRLHTARVQKPTTHSAAYDVSISSLRQESSSGQGMVRKIVIPPEMALDGKEETFFLRMGHTYSVTDVWRKDDGVAIVELFSPWGPVVCPTAKQLIARTKNAVATSGGATGGANGSPAGSAHDLSGLRRQRSTMKSFRAFNVGNDRKNSENNEGGAFGADPAVDPHSPLPTVDDEIGPIVHQPVLDACYFCIRYELLQYLFGKVDVCEVAPRTHHLVEAGGLTFGTIQQQGSDAAGDELIETPITPYILEVCAPLQMQVKVTLEQERRIFNADLEYPEVTEKPAGYNTLELKVTALRSGEQFSSFVPVPSEDSARPCSMADVERETRFSYPPRKSTSQQLSLPFLAEPGRYLIAPAITSGPAVKFLIRVTSNPLTVMTLYELNPLAAHSGACTKQIPRPEIQTEDSGLVASVNYPAGEGDGKLKKRQSVVALVVDDREAANSLGKAAKQKESLRQFHASKGCDLDAGSDKAFEEADVLQRGRLDSRGLQRAAMEFFLKHTAFGQQVGAVAKEMRDMEIAEAEGELSPVSSPSGRRGSRRRSSVASAGTRRRSSLASGRSGRRGSSIGLESEPTKKEPIVMDAAAFQRLMLDALASGSGAGPRPESPLPPSDGQTQGVVAKRAP